MEDAMRNRALLASLFLATFVAAAAGATTRGYANVSYRGGSSARVDVGFFYDELSPYGRWVDRGDYGWAWCPRHVASGWRPYTVGRWVDSDYGWTWASDEPFGWATYHYGRWAWDPDLGWIWVPGTDWGPAWVSWQYGDGYVGWAPLPPQVGFQAGIGLRLGGFDLSLGLPARDYVFVGERSFLEPRVGRFGLPPSRNDFIFRRTRNFTRYAVAGNRVIDQGVPIDRIERATNRRVQRLRVAEVSNLRAAGIQRDQLRVFRPEASRLRTVRVAQRNNAGLRVATAPERRRQATQERALTRAEERRNGRQGRGTAAVRPPGQIRAERQAAEARGAAAERRRVMQERRQTLPPNRARERRPPQAERQRQEAARDRQRAERRPPQASMRREMAPQRERMHAARAEPLRQRERMPAQRAERPVRQREWAPPPNRAPRAQMQPRPMRQREAAQGRPPGAQRERPQRQQPPPQGGKRHGHGDQRPPNA
jgi:hypothetical protein